MARWRFHPATRRMRTTPRALRSSYNRLETPVSVPRCSARKVRSKSFKSLAASSRMPKLLRDVRVRVVDDKSPGIAAPPTPTLKPEAPAKRAGVVGLPGLKHELHWLAALSLRLLTPSDWSACRISSSARCTLSLEPAI
eukprot:scaffold33875_cov27-Tisochrysis_lutea.AAC.1